MALNEQMQQMIQQDIKDAETIPKEKILKDQMDGLKTAGRTVRDIAVESIPGVGEEIAARRVEEALKAGDKVGAGIEATAGLLGIVPGVGDALAQGVRKTKAPLRKLLDKLPQKEIDELPSQPDDMRIYGYHGTARERKPDEPFFDINFARKNDQFLGEGFYFTLDPKVAEEYSNLRAFRDFDVEPLQKGKDPVLTHRRTGKQTTVGNLQKGLDIDGNPLTMGQSVSRFDLSNIEKPYVVRTEKQRKELKDKIPELKKQGYDAVLFADFKDRSKQIMVFPEHMDKIDTSAIAGRSATSTVKDAEPLQIGINPATKDGSLLRNYNADIANSMIKNAKKANAGTTKANKLIDAKVADGTKVGIRLNLNSTIPDMPRGLDKLQTLHQKNYNGKALSYRAYATVENVTFNVNQKGRQGIAAKIKGVDVPEAKNKFPAMSVDGELNNTRNILNEMDDDVVEIGFNPMNSHLFVDLSTGQAVKGADVATVIGDRVYAKGVTYMKKADAPTPLDASDGTPLPSEVRYKMKKGGVIPMKRMAEQMELFEPVKRGFDEGGLMDEGGMVDEESGNEVPPGSTKEEVRDDIPAQLSEGEFVFPADVVRYIGLEKLMRMRQEAKMGLRMMEEMGQMGNGDEATVPDDLPFDMYDLDIEDEEEYSSDELNMQAGGMVPTYNPRTGTYSIPGSGMGGYQPPQAPTTGYTPYGGIQPYTQPLQYTGTQYTTAEQTSNIPTFGDMVGRSPGQYDEFRTYVNDAGQTLQIPFKDGKPLYPIPEGYSEKGEEPTTEVAPIEQRVETTRVRDEGGGRDDDTTPTGGTIALGGKAVGKPEGGGIPGTRYAGPSRQRVGATVMDVSFDVPGFNPITGFASFARDMLSSDPNKGLPKDATGFINVRGGTVGAHKVSIPATDYNKIRNDLMGDLAKDYQGAANLAEALENGTYSYDPNTRSITDVDGNRVDINNLPDDLARGVDKLGESISRNVKNDMDGGMSMVEAGQNLTDAEKAGLSMYNDKQFADAEKEGGLDVSAKDRARYDAQSKFSQADVATGKDGGGRTEDDDSGMGSGSDPSSNEGFGGGDDSGQVGSMDFKYGGLVKQTKQSGIASKK